MAKKKKTTKKKSTGKKKTTKSRSKVKKTSKASSWPPSEQEDESAMAAGQSALTRRYFLNVRSVAKDILEDASKQYSSYEDAEEWIIDRIHEEADGSYWVIYTHAAMDTLVASDNWLAIDDVGMDVDGSDLSKMITQAAYFALEQDLRQQVEAEKDDYFKGDLEDNPRRVPARNVVKSRLLR